MRRTDPGLTRQLILKIPARHVRLRAYNVERCGLFTGMRGKQLTGRCTLPRGTAAPTVSGRLATRSCASVPSIGIGIGIGREAHMRNSRIRRVASQVRRLRVIGLVAAVVLAAVTLAAPLAQAAAGPNNTNKDAHECLLNFNQMCWDVKDGNLKPGQLVYLYNKNKAQADGWATVNDIVTASWPFTIRRLDHEFQNDKVFQFKKVLHGILVGNQCLGEVGGRIQLKLCDAGTGYTLWVRAGNRLVNVERSDAINAPAYLYTLSLNNASPLHVGPARGYYRWALQQCCNL